MIKIHFIVTTNKTIINKYLKKVIFMNLNLKNKLMKFHIHTQLISQKGSRLNLINKIIIITKYNIKKI
jgi:hypothetical protein